MLVNGQSKRTVNMSDACISGQNASCVHTVVSHFIQSTVSFFYKNAQPMSSFFLKFCHSFD